MKKARIVLTVLSSIFLAGWIALFVVFAMLTAKAGGTNNIATYFTECVLPPLSAVFRMAPITSGLDSAGDPAINGLIPIIGTYSFVGIYGLFAVLTAVMMFVKDRPSMLVYFFLIVLFVVPGVQTMSMLPTYVTAIKDTSLQLLHKIILWCVLGFAALEVVVSLILAIITPFSFVSSKVKAEQKQRKAEKKARIAAAANPQVPAIEHQPEPEPREPQLSRYELANLIREIVRDEVSRADAGRSQPAPAAPIIVTPPAAPEKPAEEPKQPGSSVHTVTGATFGGPLVVQYFYGVTPGQPVQQQAAPAPVSEPVKEEPVKEEPVVEEPAPVEEPVVEEPVVEEVVEPAVVEEPVVVEPVVEEVAPVVEEPVVELPTEAKPPVVRIPFEERIVSAEKEMRENYNELKNELLSWGVKSRISNSGDTFRLHRKTYCKITVAGKSLKLYLALDPKDYADSPIPHSDAGEKNAYAEIPFVFKVKSPLSMKRAKQLIQDAMEKDGLEQGVVENVNWVKEIKAALKAAK